MPVAALTPELIVLVGAVTVLLFALAAPRRLQRGAPVLAALSLAAAGAAAAIQLTGSPRLVFSGTYAVDQAAVWGKLVVLAVALGTVALAVPWFRPDPRYGELFALILFSALGAVLVAGAADLMELLLALLLSSAAGAVLAAYHRRSRRSAEAAMKYYLLGALANGLMLFGAALLFGLAGTTTYAGIRDALAGSGNWTVAAATGLLAIGLAFTMGAVPAHAWLPDVAEGAPVPSAAFLTTAGKVAALVAMARLFTILPESAAAWRTVAAVLAVLTMTLGNLAALRQDDVRRLLGWSAVSQTGYGLMAVASIGRSALAVPSLILFVIAYAAANVAAFGAICAVRGLTDRRAYAGLARARPWTALALALALLSFIGIPPLVGFTAKLALFGAAIEAGYTWLAVAAAVNTVVSIAYYARVLGPVYFDAPAGRVGRFAGAVTVAVAAATGAVVAAGVGTGWLLGLLGTARLLP